MKVYQVNGEESNCPSVNKPPPGIFTSLFGSKGGKRTKRRKNHNKKSKKTANKMHKNTKRRRP